MVARHCIILTLTTETERNKMKNITLTKRAKVEAPKELKDAGVVAFQVVDFVVDYFGNKIESSHDTKILEDGRQLVIGGDGFIREGFEVAA
jgi:hypothetical protein